MGLRPAHDMDAFRRHGVKLDNQQTCSRNYSICTAPKQCNIVKNMPETAAQSTCCRFRPGWQLQRRCGNDHLRAFPTHRRSTAIAD